MIINKKFFRVWVTKEFLITNCKRIKALSFVKYILSIDKDNKCYNGRFITCVCK